MKRILTLSAMLFALAAVGLMMLPGSQANETGETQGMDHGVCAAGEHDIGIAAAQDVGRFSDRLGAGGTCGQAIKRWAAASKCARYV